MPHLTTFAITAVLALIAWGAVIYKAYHLRRRPTEPLSWAVLGIFLSLALALTLPQPPVVDLFARLTGLPTLAFVLQDSVTIGACWIGLAYIGLLQGADGRRLRPIRRAGALAIGTILVLLARLIVAPDAVEHQVAATLPALYMTGSRALFLVVVAVHLALAGAMLSHYLRLVEQRPVRRRLWLLRAAAMVALGYFGVELVRVVLPWPDWVSVLFAVPSGLLVILGLLLSPWLRIWSRLTSRGPVRRSLAWWGTYRAYRQLAPLWRMLYPVKPAQALLPPRRRLDWWPGPDLTFRAVRRVIEILDWMLALRPYRVALASSLAEAAARRAGLTGSERTAFIEAVMLATALARWERGQPSDDTQSPAPAVTGPMIAQAPDAVGRAMWDDEVAHLVRVTRYLLHSPAVREIRDTVVARQVAPAQPAAQ